MATRNVTPLPAANPDFYRPRTFTGTTISDLDKMVERALTTGPLMSVAQIRILLRVEQACEACDARGFTESRGDFSEFISQDRCDVCRGKGYVVPENQAVAQ